MLPPLFAGDGIYTAKGLLDVQLEVPPYSTLSAQDIDRILAIASWSEGTIEDKIERFDGGRSVLIRRQSPRIVKPNSQTEYQLSRLQLNGIGYLPMKVVNRGLGFCEERMHPPTADNYYDLLPPEMGLTTTIHEGVIGKSRPGYDFYGSNTERRAITKIKNTRFVCKLGIDSILLTPVEAYGRYPALEHDGEHATFIVFAAPAFERVPNFMEKVGNLDAYLNSFARCLGSSIRNLHEAPHEQGKGAMHYQLHIGNISYNDPMLFFHDWATMESGIEITPVHRAAELAVVQKSLFYYLKGHIRSDMHALLYVTFSDALLKSYCRNEGVDYCLTVTSHQFQSDHEANMYIIANFLE